MIFLSFLGVTTKAFTELFLRMKNMLNLSKKYLKYIVTVSIISSVKLYLILMRGIATTKDIKNKFGAAYFEIITIRYFF